MKSMLGSDSPVLDEDDFWECWDIAKDWLAHRKFLKNSAIFYSPEIPRKDLPKGPREGLDGWKQWRQQFAPKRGQDMSIVDKELERLHIQRTLNSDEYGRLRRLYCLDMQAEPQASKRLVEEVCRCGERLSWTPIYRRFYCYSCKKYPPVCIECRHDLFWVSQYNRYYCNACNSYRELSLPSDTKERFEDRRDKKTQIS